jgi:hypothetical protein
LPGTVAWGWISPRPDTVGIIYCGIAKEKTMTIELTIQFLAWATLINYGILVWWFLWLVLRPEWIYAMHNRWFKISEEVFYTAHYSLIGLYKLLIFIFLLVPYLVLRFII